MKDTLHSKRSSQKSDPSNVSSTLLSVLKRVRLILSDSLQILESDECLKFSQILRLRFVVQRLVKKSALSCSGLSNFQNLSFPSSWV